MTRLRSIVPSPQQFFIYESEPNLINYRNFKVANGEL